jgi:hypothetical protein
LEASLDIYQLTLWKEGGRDVGADGQRPGESDLPQRISRESDVYLDGPACRHWAEKRAPNGFVAWRHRTGELFDTPPHVYAVKAALGTSSVVQQEAYPFLPNPSSSRPVRMR